MAYSLAGRGVLGRAASGASHVFVDYDTLLAKLKKSHIHYTELSKDDNMFGYVV